MKRCAVKIAMLSAVTFALLVFIYLVRCDLECKRQILNKQKLALQKAPIISKELKELEDVISNARLIDIPSGEERYLKLLSFWDLLSLFEDAQIKIVPPVSLPDMKDVYSLTVSFDTDNWGKVGKLFKFFDSVVYPIVYVKEIKLDVQGNDRAKFFVSSDIMVNISRKKGSR